jgi:hypothetical protein
MIDLTHEQRANLENGKAVDFVDPETSQHYVVMKKETYDNVRRLIYDGSEWSDDELRLQLARSSKDNGWEDPGMDAYDRYDEERRPS